MSGRVLLIDDDAAMRHALTQTLELEDITVLQADSLAQARRSIRSNFAGIVLSDIRMPREDGFDVLRKVQSSDPDLPVIFLTGEADIPMAVRALRNGAYDFLEKPCGTEDLLKSIRRALRHRDLVLQARRLETQLQRSDVAAIRFPGQTPASTRLRSDLRRVATSQANVYLQGAPGVGRRLAAHTIFVLTPEAQATASVNLLDPDAAAQILALQGQDADTLIAKNIDLIASDDLYGSLRQFSSSQPPRRLLTTGSAPLSDLDDTLREILGTCVEIAVPSLYQRAGDLPVIFEALIRQAARDLNVDLPVLPGQAFAELADGQWPGNLPELRAHARAQVIGLTSSSEGAQAPGLNEQMDDFERSVLIETLKRHKGRVTAAAQELKLPRKTMYDRMSRLGIRPKELRESDQRQP